MVESSQGMVAFLGVPPDRRLLDEDLVNLPEAEQHHEPVVSTERHDRLVAAGSLANRCHPDRRGGTAALWRLCSFCSMAAARSAPSSP